MGLAESIIKVFCLVLIIFRSDKDSTYAYLSINKRDRIRLLGFDRATIEKIKRKIVKESPCRKGPTEKTSYGSTELRVIGE